MEQYEDALDDFEIRPEKESEAGIKIVGKNQNEHGIKKAEPKPYSYQDRFKKKQLRIEDVMSRPKRYDLSKFTDVELIEADKNRPNSRRLFYGPGIEQDL